MPAKPADRIERPLFQASNAACVKTSLGRYNRSYVKQETPHRIRHNRHSGRRHHHAGYILIGNKEPEPESPQVVETERQPQPPTPAPETPGDQPHRENDLPAWILYYEDGEIDYEAWYLNGELIKENRPNN